MIEHVSFTLSRQDAAACAGFYELLGFARVEPPAGLRERSIWLRSGPTSIHLMFRERDGAEISASPPSAAGHIALVVPNYAATLGALQAAGVRVEPRSEYWGSPRAYVLDPAGNTVELMASAPELGGPA